MSQTKIKNKKEHNIIAVHPLLAMLFGNNDNNVEIEEDSTYIEGDYIAKLKKEVATPIISENKNLQKNGGFSEGLSKFNSTLEKMQKYNKEENNKGENNKGENNKGKDEKEL